MPKAFLIGALKLGLVWFTQHKTAAIYSHLVVFTDCLGQISPYILQKTPSEYLKLVVVSVLLSLSMRFESITKKHFDICPVKKEINPYEQLLGWEFHMNT